jgi:D-sedoheptulose 7-phosphate isomerase
VRTVWSRGRRVPLQSESLPGRDGQARDLIDDHITVAGRTKEALTRGIEAFAATACETLARGGKLIVFGNGGSAADAQHLAAELTGHFVTQREPLPAVALTTDSSALTAIANDYEFADVFARQVRALCRPEDLVIGISTSGRAENVIRGLAAGREFGARTVALTGGDGGRLAPVADHALVVPSDETARIQEMHILIIHVVCALIDDWEAARRGRAGEDHGEGREGHEGRGVPA